MSKEYDEIVASSSLPSFDGLAGDALVLKEIISRREAEKELVTQIIESGQKTCRDAVLSIRESECALRSELEQRISDSHKREKVSIRELEKAYHTRQKPLVALLNDIQTLIKRDNGRIAPIRKLPAELLSSTFEYHVVMGGSPWALTLVSRSWKQTAETTPRLWTNISIRHVPEIKVRHYHGLSSWEVDGEDRCSFKGMIVCRSVEELVLVISRAGSLSLTLSIDLDNCQKDVTYAALYDSTITPRVVSLNITGKRNGIIKDEDQLFGPFTGLVNLHISSLAWRVFDNVLTSISQSASKLQRFTVFNSFMSKTSQYTFWSSLNTLELNGTVTPSLLNLVLPHLKQVKTLKGCPEYWPNQETHLTTLSVLNSLEVSCETKYLHLLNLPALDDLNLFQKGRDPESRLAITDSKELAFNFPTLRRLRICTSNPAPWISGFSAPLLQFLEYEDCGENEWSLDGLCCPAVDEVILQKVHSIAAAISVLKSVPNARTILMVPRYNVTKLWVIGLLQRLADPMDLVCPRLTSFTLGTKDYDLGTNKTTAKPIIRKVLRDRSQLGIKMDSFKVYWKGRTSGVDGVDYV